MSDPTTKLDDLKGRAIRGGLAKLVSQGASLLLRVATLAVLARLLTPHDFGIVAMVIAVTGLLDIVASGGLASAAIQSGAITQEQMSKLFWVNLAIGAFIGLLWLAVAPLMASFYHEDRLREIAPAYAVVYLLVAAGVQHSALLERQLRYLAVAGIEIAAQCLSAATAILLAAMGYRYWSLVFGTVCYAAAATVGFWSATRWVPGLPRRRVQVRSLLSFGGTVTLNGAIVYVAYNLEKVLLGRYWGPAALGLYGRAFQLINLPTAAINSAVGGVALSALSRLQDNPARHRDYFLKGYSLVMSLTMPLTIVCAVFAEDIVAVLLGRQWDAAVPVFRLLAPTVLIFGIINPLAWLMLSLGLQRRSLYISMAIAPLVIVAVILGMPHGPTGVALAYSTALSLWLLPHVFWCLHGTAILPRDLAVAAGRPLAAAVCAGVLGIAAAYPLQSLDIPILRLAAGSAIVLSAHFAILLFGFGQFRLYSDVLRGRSAAVADPSTP